MPEDNVILNEETPSTDQAQSQDDPITTPDQTEPPPPVEGDGNEAWIAEMAGELGLDTPDDIAAPPVETPPAVDEHSDEPPPEPTGDASETAEPADPIEELPETKPKPDHWKRMREIHKEDTDRIRELVKALDDAKRLPEPTRQEAPTEGTGVFGDAKDVLGYADPRAADAPAEAPAQADTGWLTQISAQSAAAPYPDGQKPASTVPTPDDVFLTLAGMETGEVAEADGRNAGAYVSHMSPQDVMNVIGRADANAYGENSRDIAALARQRLPEVQESWKGRQQQLNAFNTWQGERTRALREVGAMEGMDNTESEQWTRYLEHARELEQTIPVLQYAPNAPTVVRDYMELKQKASMVDDLQARVAELEGRVQAGSEPQSSGDAGAAAVPGTGDEAWDAAMRGELDDIGLGHLAGR